MVGILGGVKRLATRSRVFGSLFVAPCLRLGAHLLRVAPFVVLFLVPTSVFAAEQLGWNVAANGDILSISDFDEYNGGTYFMGTSTNPNAGNFPVCSGGSSGLGTFSAQDRVGLNVFTDGGIGEGNCSTAGTYFLVYTESSPFANTLYYYSLYYDGETVAETYIPTFAFDNTLQLKTRFLDMNITNATTAGNINFTVDWYLDPNEINPSVPERNVTAISFTLVTEEGSTTRYSFNIATTTGTSTETFTLLNSQLLNNETYELLVQFDNAQRVFTGVIPFPLSYLQTSFVISATLLTSFSEIENYNSNFTTSEATLLPCSITAIDNCIINAFTYMVLPSQQSIDNFNSLASDFETRIPFVYAYEIPSVFGELFANTGTSTGLVYAETDIGTINFISKEMLEDIPLSTTIRTMLSYLIWVMLAFTVYRRVLSIHNKETTV